MAQNPPEPILRLPDQWPPALQSAWDDYREHRQELRKPLTRVAERRLTTKLEAWGHTRALAALEWSMENGWLGVFEPPSQREENAQRGSFKLDDWLDQRQA